MTEWAQMHADVAISGEIGKDLQGPLLDHLNRLLQEATEQMMREMSLDVEYGFDSRHRPDSRDWQTILQAERYASRFSRAVADLDGHGTVAWRAR